MSISQHSLVLSVSSFKRQPLYKQPLSQCQLTAHFCQQGLTTDIDCWIQIHGQDSVGEGISQLVCESPHIWKRKWWLYASLHFSLLGQEEQTNPMQVWKALELLVPLPHWWLGPAGVVAAFSLPLHLTEEPGLPLALCNTKLHSSRVAWPRQCSSPQWVGLASWLREAGGECVPTYSVPYLCPSVQPAKKKVSFQPASNTRCPPSAVSSAAAWNRDMSWNTQDTKNFFEAFLIEVNSLGYIWSAEKRQTVQESSHSHASSWTME